MKPIYVFFLLFFTISNGFTRQEQNKLGKELISKAKVGDFSLLKDYARKNANLNYQDSDGKTILIYAVKFNNPDAINFLATFSNSLDNKLDPNLLDEENLSALMHSAAKGDKKAVSELLKFNNLNINRQGKYGETALDWAHSPRSFYSEQVKFISKISDVPKVRMEIIDLLQHHGAKSANELEKQQEKVIIE